MTGADLLYSPIEEELRSSVRDLLSDHCPPSAVLARCETDTPLDPALWRVLGGEIGLAGLLVPKALGGADGSAREAAVVLEELGSAVAPVPFFTSAVLATSALLACPTDSEPVAELLLRLSRAEGTAVVAAALSHGPGAAFPGGVRAVSGHGAGVALTGRVGTVADAAAADVLIVPAVGDDGPGLFAVAADASGVVVRPAVALDLTRPLADLSLDGAPGERLAGPGLAEEALDQALVTGAGLLASEQLGVAQWCLDTTVRYVRERTQFGRRVGSFQGLKHRLADLWQQIVAARAAARHAADALARGAAEVPIAVAVAQAYCAPVAVLAAQECIQLHGGIGMTWEHPAHLYLKRAKADELALGTPGRHRARLAALVDLPAADPR